MATSQEITAAVHEAERRILPARLADVPKERREQTSDLGERAGI